MYINSQDLTVVWLGLDVYIQQLEDLIRMVKEDDLPEKERILNQFSHQLEDAKKVSEKITKHFDERADA